MAKNTQVSSRVIVKTPTPGNDSTSLGDNTVSTSKIQDLAVTSNKIQLSPTITTPTIVTNATVPLVIGGTAVSSSLTLKSTSGVGTSDSILMKVGNNGAVTAMTIDTTGKVGIGQTVPTDKLNVEGTANSALGIRIRNTNAGSSAFSSIIFGNDEGVEFGNIKLNSGANTALAGAYGLNIGTSSTSPFGIHTNNINRVLVDTSGNVGIGVTPTTRNNTRLQILDGIGFPATQVASTDVNTLDDYQEGTWTPVVTAASGSITTYTASGYYTKIGDVVMATVYITITTNGTGGDALIATMPVAASSAIILQVGSGRESASTGSMLQGYIEGSSSNLYITKYDNTYPAANGRVLFVTIKYKV